jgi:hypothetical protein
MVVMLVILVELVGLLVRVVFVLDVVLVLASVLGAMILPQVPLWDTNGNGCFESEVIRLGMSLSGQRDFTPLSSLLP